MIKIDKKVALPKASQRGVYPFTDMDVGDSFTVPLKNAKSARTAAYAYARRYGVKFTTRTSDGKTLRIWRSE